MRRELQVEVEGNFLSEMYRGSNLNWVAKWLDFQAFPFNRSMTKINVDTASIRPLYLYSQRNKSLMKSKYTVIVILISTDTLLM